MKYLFIPCWIFFATLVTAQENETLTFRSLGAGYEILYQGSKIEIEAAQQKLKTISASRKEIRKGRALYGLGLISGAFGAYIMARQVRGSYYGYSREYNKIGITISLGLMSSTIPLTKWHNRHLERAIDMYNFSIHGQKQNQ